MAYLIFGGDLFVTGFMVALVVWISLRQNNDQMAAAARIPLEDEVDHG
jgi:cbb3-type cytochrome oxidase subunit 3